MAKAASKLVLGTANFGVDYGINNPSGKVSGGELTRILDLAQQSGIGKVDTAQAYGDSEARLGPRLSPTLKVITKFGVGQDHGYQRGSLHGLVQESLDRLNRDSLYGLMLHRPEQLLSKTGADLIHDLRDLQQAGLVEKIGVSIYGPDLLPEITQALDLDIIQAPFNMFDHRLQRSGWAERLKASGTEIHVRSAFLQGLLLMSRQNLNPWFTQNWPEVFDRWFTYQQEAGETADQIALGFVLDQPWIDHVVVGVDSADQLSQLVYIESNRAAAAHSGFAVDDLSLIDPSKWKLS